LRTMSSSGEPFDSLFQAVHPVQVNA
jgi:hypothetical protein